MTVTKRKKTEQTEKPQTEQTGALKIEQMKKMLASAKVEETRDATPTEQTKTLKIDEMKEMLAYAKVETRNAIYSAAVELYEENRHAEKIDHICDMQTLLEDYSYVLKQTRSSLAEKIAGFFEKMADAYELLAKMVLVSYSKRAPDEVSDELLRKAKEYEPQFFDAFKGEGREDALKAIEKLRSSKTIDEAIMNLNDVLYIDVEGFAKAFKPEDESYRPENEERGSSYFERIRAINIGRLYRFLRGFDEEKVEELKEWERKEPYEGIGGVSIGSLKKHIFPYPAI